MLIDVAFIVMGLVGLYFGGEWLIKASSRLATSLGVPALVVGLTIVAFGTSAPELFVSISAALQGSSDLSVGNVVGSNIANIGLIMGLAGLVLPLMIHVSLIKREIPIMIGISVIMVLMALDGQISRVDGLILAVGYGAFTVLLYRFSTPSKSDAEYEEEVEAVEGNPKQIGRGREAMRLITGLALLVLGAQAMVYGAVNIARNLGVSELLIGITLVAVGTSLPEIATSLLAIRRGHSDIAVGNAIGSNIANILAVLGLTAVVNPLTVDTTLLSFELPVMMGFAVVSLLLVLDRRLARWQAGLLLAAYVAFVVLMVLRA
jgi:cation:H+ antiporter